MPLPTAVPASMPMSKAVAPPSCVPVRPVAVATRPLAGSPMASTPEALATVADVVVPGFAASAPVAVR